MTPPEYRRLLAGAVAALVLGIATAIAIAGLVMSRGAWPAEAP